ncbi:glycoside hydrolase family 3 N-terminal domain-containing protein [Pseudonocardia abyssalis]|uniref:Glycoside hydrolase family 3 protein n=1 Tax=Pseudonocardia abyssalis TaxID=2792008 RepID=A0ABS6UW09_9PSEU|nr:glycoside hydrolase family 3 N-terminal domain-containing protein [Pseudonocardia abyssalis]MBW0116632.1 glycoside hydrolase family 3 protein [Pseudonocardia abyssalis]MBW0136151.1 glycoside hydrolase family 3 protein [Pseudonocardia abyssalis]
MTRPSTPAHHASVRLRSRAHPARRRPAGPWLVGLAAGVLASTAVFLAPAAAVPVQVLAAPAVLPVPDDRLPECAAVLGEMTPRAVLAQRLMVGVDVDDPEAAAETVRESQVGGIFLPGNATALLQDQSLRALQAGARIPVTVAVDDEGGRVQRIDELDGDLPSAREMSALTPDEVRDLAEERGRQLVARGVTMDIAPVVDLGGQSDREVIGDRSFGTDPDDVTRYALAFAQGLQEAGIAPVVKHFPGHGRADGDSHAGRVTSPPLEDLRTADLRPYADLVGPGAPLTTGALPASVMVGHLDVPGLTDGLPSSLTPAVYALLRDEYGFTGVVYTDDLGAMKAITGEYDLPEAVLAALDAGSDVALWSAGGDPGPILDALEPALADGTLDAAENTAAVTRILRAKSACG